MTLPLIATIGNPNSGKTSLFNALTGARQQVGNWSGVTVDKKIGYCQIGAAGTEQAIEVLDLPGIYSLAGIDASIDEHISTDYVLTGDPHTARPQLLLNVVDVHHLARSLYLSIQLRELGLPLVLVINKLDLLRKRREVLRVSELAQALDVPVVALSAHNAGEVQQFKAQLPELLAQARTPRAALTLDYGRVLEMALTQLADLAPDAATDPALSARGCALRYLENPSAAPVPALAACVAQTQHAIDVDVQLADVRYDHIHRWVAAAVPKASRSLQGQWLDNILLHRVAGLPIFLAVMYLMFMFAINVGSAFIDFFDILAGALFIDGPKFLLAQLHAPSWLGSLLADGLGSGIQTVATFIPVIACLYLFLSTLESSGYLARAAFVVDALMRKLGLPGKAFVPLLMGFGCNVPAIMATRTLGSMRERLMTSAMAPFMSCGARLPIYSLFAVAFFPENGQNLVFALYVLGICVAVLTGLWLRSTLLPGSSDSLLMELPDYEWPRPRAVLLTTWHKLHGFVFGAGKTIVLVVALLSMLNAIGTDGRVHLTRRHDSLLSYASQQVTPLLAPMGVQADNWPATVGLVTGIFAKEALVGTLDALYQTAPAAAPSAFSLRAALQEAIASIGHNLAAIDPLDPLGLSVGELDDQQQAASEQAVAASTYRRLQQQFDGTAGALAYLLFVLLYMPCAAAMGALVRETGRSWALLTAAWCNYIAFMAATLCYQFGTFSAHPAQSLGWLAIFSSLSAALWLLGRRYGRRLLPAAPALQAVAA
ncbi:MAG: Fe(2+) transporter permease subunit FeoB [Aeromonas sp.]